MNEHVAKKRKRAPCKFDGAPNLWRPFSPRFVFLWFVNGAKYLVQNGCSIGNFTLQQIRCDLHHTFPIERSLNSAHLEGISFWEMWQTWPPFHQFLYIEIT